MGRAIGLARGDDVLGLLGLGDDTDRPGLDAGLLANAGREFDVIARRDGDLLGRGIAARAGVDEIATQRLELARGLYRLLDRHPALDPFDAGEPHAQGLVGRPDLAAGLE